jgi:plasmid stabilization system protein ParE
MKRYVIRFTPNVRTEIKQLFNTIAYDFGQPLTARRYRDGLLHEIRRLARYAGSIAPSQSDYVQFHYGPGARHITYKKMTIIYAISGDYVLIKHITSSRLIR